MAQFALSAQSGSGLIRRVFEEGEGMPLPEGEAKILNREPLQRLILAKEVSWAKTGDFHYLSTIL